MANLKYSKTMMYEETGAISGAHYKQAPASYKLGNGDYTMECEYIKDESVSTCENNEDQVATDAETDSIAHTRLAVKSVLFRPRV
jgi:hypothetical protein